MTAFLSIGDFARASHLTVKTLRHYHRIGLLEPAAIDQHSAYRRYSTDQLPIARVIRRLRELDMPLAEIRGLLAAAEPESRREHIEAHRARLHSDLDRTRRALVALDDLLDPDRSGQAGGVSVRRVPAAPAAAITEVVDAADGSDWLHGALGELYGTLAARGAEPLGPAGGIYLDDVFTRHRGEMTVFVPCAAVVPEIGRVRGRTVPAGDFAVIMHAGHPAEVDRSYAELATYVARHALAVDGPIREYYPVSPRDTADPSRWRTEIAWPILMTTASSAASGQ
jgi:DNA-binding transcriptional MerR regulator